MAVLGKGGAMAAVTDSACNSYVEFVMSKDERIRVTYIQHQAWADGPTIRIQKRAYTGRVSPGPEFPADKAPALVSALTELTRT
jgi:hypothetical protein